MKRLNKRAEGESPSVLGGIASIVLLVLAVVVIGGAIWWFKGEVSSLKDFSPDQYSRAVIACGIAGIGSISEYTKPTYCANPYSSDKEDPSFITCGFRDVRAAVSASKGKEAFICPDSFKETIKARCIEKVNDVKGGKIKFNNVAIDKGSGDTNVATACDGAAAAGVGGTNTLLLLSNGAACTANSECQSGLCREKVCVQNA